MSIDHPSTPPPEYRTQSEDTDFEVEQMMVQAYRRMPPWEKIRDAEARAPAPPAVPLLSPSSAESGS